MPGKHVACSQACPVPILGQGLRAGLPDVGENPHRPTTGIPWYSPCPYPRNNRRQNTDGLALHCIDALLTSVNTSETSGETSRTWTLVLDSLSQFPNISTEVLTLLYLLHSRVSTSLWILVPAWELMILPCPPTTPCGRTRIHFELRCVGGGMG